MKTWIIVAVIVVLGAVMILVTRQALAPAARTALGPQTTYISSPLASDGLPNYALAIMERQANGVTPENNAAALMWAAMGPRELSPQHFDRVCSLLGVPNDRGSAYLTAASDSELRERLVAWIAAQGPAEQPVVEPIEEMSGTMGLEEEYRAADYLADRALELAGRTPWTAEQLPPLAAWVAANEAPLDLLVAASARPRFYSPSPNVLANPDVTVVEILLPHVQAVREAVRSLAARAMFRVGEGKYEQAWQDCRACWRYGTLAAHGSTLVEKLVGYAIRGVAKDCTLALLAAEDAPPELLRQVLEELRAVPEDLDLRDAIDNGERLMMLDTTLRMLTGRLGGVSDEIIGVNDETLRMMQKFVSFDASVPLSMANQWYDRIAVAADMADWREREAALERIENDLRSINNDLSVGRVIGSVFNRGERSEMAGEFMVSTMMPAITSVFTAEQRDQTQLALVRIAAALAVYRQSAGEYPEDLDALAPGILDAVPVDQYSSQPFIYERRGAGYVLYSVGQNRVDDGGDDWSGWIVDGEWVDERNTEASSSNSDMVIRVPGRAFDIGPVRVSDEKRPADTDSNLEESETSAEAE